MKILAVNGSPRGEKGMTWLVLERFIEGAKKAGAEVEVMTLAGKRIHPCTGEFACWFKTPGKCIHRDDAESLMESVESAESIVLATPVYVDGMTGLMKNFLDRTMPLADPHFEMRQDHLRHPLIHARTNKVALVSVCGFPELDNFDPLLAHVKAICKNMNAQFSGAVLRPAAPILPYLKVRHPLRVRAVMKAMEKAGSEFAQRGRISRETEEAAAEEIISKEAYLDQCNWFFDKELGKLKGY